MNEFSPEFKGKKPVEFVGTVEFAGTVEFVGTVEFAGTVDSLVENDFDQAETSRLSVSQKHHRADHIPDPPLQPPGSSS